MYIFTNLFLLLLEVSAFLTMTGGTGPFNGGDRYLSYSLIGALILCAIIHGWVFTKANVIGKILSIIGIVACVLVGWICFSQITGESDLVYPIGDLVFYRE